MFDAEISFVIGGNLVGLLVCAILRNSFVDIQVTAAPVSNNHAFEMPFAFNVINGRLTFLLLRNATPRVHSDKIVEMNVFAIFGPLWFTV